MHVLRYGIGCFRHCATFFGRFFRKKIFPAAPPARIVITARIIITPAGILLRVRIFF